MKNIIRYSLLLMLLSCCFLSQAQVADTTHIQFLKYKNGKPKSIKVGREISVELKSTVPDSLICEETMIWSVHGNLYRLNDSCLVLRDARSFLDHEWKDSSFYMQKYSRAPYSINLKQIDHIWYEPKIARPLAIGAGVSFLTGFVIAPLVSYNWGTGEFDGSRYKKIAGVSFTAALTFSVSLAVFSSRKLTLKELQK